MLLLAPLLPLRIAGFITSVLGLGLIVPIISIGWWVRREAAARATPSGTRAQPVPPPHPRCPFRCSSGCLTPRTPRPALVGCAAVTWTSRCRRCGAAC